MTILKAIPPSFPGLLLRVFAVAVLVFVGSDSFSQDKKRSKRGQAESDAPAPSSSKSSRSKNKKPFLSSPSPRPGGDQMSPLQSGTSRRSSRRGSGDQPYRGRSASGRKVTQRRPQTRAVFVYSQSGYEINNPRPEPDRRQRASDVRLPSSVSGDIGAPVGPRVARDGLSNKRRLPGQRGFSSPFVAAARRNPYWGKTRLDHGPVMRDLTGRPLRRRDFRSTTSTTSDRSRVSEVFRSGGDRAAVGTKRSGGVRTATQTGRSWSGDISGRRVRAGRVSGAAGGFSGESVGANLARNGMKYGKRIPTGRSEGAMQREINANRRNMNNVSEQPNREQNRGERAGNRSIRSASGTYVAPLRKDPYWGKTRVDHGQVTTDPTGRPLRRRDFRSSSQATANRDSVRNAARVPSRASASSSGTARKIRTNSESGRAWLGDISGRGVRADRKSGRSGSGRTIFSGQGRSGNFIPAYSNAYRNGFTRGVGGIPGRRSATFAAQPNFSRPPLGQFRMFETSTALVSGITGIVDLRVNPFNPNRSSRGNISGGFSNRARVGGITGRQAASFAARPSYSRPPLGSFRLFESSTALVSGLTGKIDLRVNPANPNRYGRRSATASGSRARVSGVTGRQAARFAARPSYSRPPLGSFRLFESSTALVSGLTGKIDLRVNPANPNRAGRRTATVSGNRARVSGLPGRQAARIAARPNYSRPPLGSFRLFETSTSLVSGLTGKVDLRVRPANPNRLRTGSIRSTSSRANVSSEIRQRQRQSSARQNYSRPPAGNFRAYRTSTSLTTGLTGVIDLRVKRSSPDRVGQMSRSNSRSSVGRPQVRRYAPFETRRANVSGEFRQRTRQFSAKQNFSKPPAGSFRAYRTSTSLTSGLTGIVDLRVKQSDPNRVGQINRGGNRRLPGQSIGEINNRLNTSAKRVNVRGIANPQSTRNNYGRSELRGYKPFDANRANVAGVLRQRMRQNSSGQNFSRPPAGNFRAYRTSTSLTSGLTGIVDLTVRRSDPNRVGRINMTGSRNISSKAIGGLNNRIRPGFNRSDVSGIANRQAVRGNYGKPQLRRYNPYDARRSDVSADLRQRMRQSSTRPNFSKPPAGQFRAYRTNTSLTTGLTGIVDLRVSRSDPNRVGRMNLASPRNVSARSIGGLNNQVRSGFDRANVGRLPNRQLVRGPYGEPRLRRFSPYASTPANVGGLNNQLAVRGDYGKPKLRRYNPYDPTQSNVSAELRQRIRQSSARPNFSKPPAGQFRAYRTNTALTTGLTGIVDIRFRRANPDEVLRKAGRNDRAQVNPQRIGMYARPFKSQIRQYEVRGRLPDIDPNTAAGKYTGNVRYGRNADNSGTIARYRGELNARQVYKDQYHTPTLVKWMRGDFAGGMVLERKGDREDQMIAGYTRRSIRNPFRSNQVNRLNMAAGNYRGNVRYGRNADNSGTIAKYSGDLNARQVYKDQYHTPTLVKLMRGDFAGGMVLERKGDREDQMIAGYSKRSYRNPFRSDWVNGPNTPDGAVRQRRPSGNITASASIRGRYRLPGQPQGTMSNRSLTDVRRIASGTGRDARGVTRQVKDKDYVLSPSGEKKAIKVNKPITGGRIQGDLKTERRENSRFADVNRDMKADQEGVRKLNGLQKAWNYLFGKAEEDPKNEKFQKPRYDPREKGIWYY